MNAVTEARCGLGLYHNHLLCLTLSNASSARWKGSSRAAFQPLQLLDKGAKPGVVHVRPITGKQHVYCAQREVSGTLFVCRDSEANRALTARLETGLVEKGKLQGGSSQLLLHLVKGHASCAPVLVVKATNSPKCAKRQHPLINHVSISHTG